MVTPSLTRCAVITGAAALLLLALDAPAPAHAAPGAQGTYTLDASTTFQVADAVAFHRREWDGERVIVLLSEAALDAADWNATLDVAGAAERFKDEASWIELELQPDGTWAGTSYALRWDGGMTSGSRYDPGFEGSMKASVGEGRVGGRLKATFEDGSVVDLTLAAPIVVPSGDPLPAGGGDAAKALAACGAAYAARDLAGVRRACETQTADIIDSALRMRADGYEMDDPWTPAGVGECNVAAVTGLAVEGGVTRGDEARVEAAGGWTEERRCSGSVYLRREDGRWRVERSALVLVSE